MPIGFLFWTLMVLWVLFWGWRGWSGPAEQRPLVGGGLLLFVLLFLLGWRVFGFVIQG